MSKILVTGATGNTGSEVIKQLTERSVPFKAMIRNKTNDAAKEVDWIEGSFADAGSLKNAFKGIEAIYLAMPAHEDYETWMRNVLSTATTAGVEHIVKLSGMGANLDAGSEIIRAHARTDDQIKASGLDYTLLQPNSFYQNTLGAIPTIKKQGAIYLPLADSRQSFIDTRDIAAVAATALTEQKHRNKTYLLSGPEALSFYDVAKSIEKAIGKPVSYYPISGEEMQNALLKMGMPDWGAEKLSEIFCWFAQGGYETVTSGVETVLGKAPRSFDDFIGDYKEMFR